MKLKKGSKIATALKYDINEDDAPKLIGKGKGKIAENIIERAKENKIPIYEDEKLAKQLETLEIGQEIPPELYEAVAQILVFIADIDSKKGY
ncbi:EscU/YscU/HrcU family type III secretion system export apparatus switch protein [Tepidibacter formicigenes]|jgi:flagellar biosynthesis protein|nr:EscU/YscU/HrcU family type III secretion system export apparatus switch protein [Tepidibacter formicigenes]